jgi:hypothetical protein
MKKIITSKKYRLNWLDFAKASLMAALTPVLVLIQNSLDAGIFVFNYKPLTMAAVGGFVAYLIKNFFTPSKTLISNQTLNNNNPATNGKQENPS